MDRNPNLLTSSLPHHLLSSTAPSSVDLPTTLSSLNHLLLLSSTAIHSLSDLLGGGDDLIPCPFNPHHRMPPSSLFRHFLLCPSSPYASLDFDPLLHSLHYPSSLHSSPDLLKQQLCFLPPLADPSADLCISLDDYLHSGIAANFFYRDCPAAVASSTHHHASKIMLSLPAILSAECANFVGARDTEIKLFSRDDIGFLASDLCMVRNEIEAWRDYPSAYSYNILRAVLGLQEVKGCNSGRWVISNSPKYGIVIDVHMRDHMVVLVRLCLKAMAREASGLLEGVVNRNVKDKDMDVNIRNTSANCPVTAKVLMWLVSQFSILYGELNGKFFAISLLKHCILESASRLLMFSSEENVSHPLTLKEGLRSLDANTSDAKEFPVRSLECEIATVNATVTSEIIYVSQVAAAVAALHERSLLEEKIKGYFAFLSLPKYQRMVEHANVTQKADEVRKSIPNYKPIIEHDGLPQQHRTDEERSKAKTIEEKLAEERDYKRRRMSYRGKKLKRSTSEVMRDIIETYMDEIKKAGGIGCFVKGGAEEGQLGSESLGNNNHVLMSGATKVSFKEDSEQSRQGHRHRRHEREYYSRSPERSWRDHEVKSSNGYDGRSSSSSNYMNTNRNYGSGSLVHNVFEDRYDPEEHIQE